MEVIRPYTREDVKKLRDRFGIEHTLAKKTATKLRHMLEATKEPIMALGALNGTSAAQCAKAGLRSIYVSGWQVAASNNTANEMYPDLGLYPSNSVPNLVRTINKTLQRCDQIDNLAGVNDTDWLCPILCDLEAGFGAENNVFELVKYAIEAGAAAVHLEDQDSSARSCGHLGSKTLIPTNLFVKKLIAARLAADVMDVNTVLVARTDAESAEFINADSDPYDGEFILANSRQASGVYKLCGTGIERSIARGLAYAPYADMIWFETSHPDIKQAEEFAHAIHDKYPGKWLAYNLSPSFNWKDNLSESELKSFHKDLFKLGYRYLFVTLAGFHSQNYGMFNLALSYNAQGMYAYSRLQEDEKLMEVAGYTGTKHQKFVGTGYFDKVKEIINGDVNSSTLNKSTETEQF